MSYRILLHSQPRNFLNKINNQLAQRIRKKLETLRKDPFPYVKRLTNSELYSLRIGDYRALIDIQENVLRIRALEHRKKVYKRFKK